MGRDNQKAGKNWEREVVKSIYPINDSFYNFVYLPSGKDLNNNIGRSGDRAPALDRSKIDIWIGKEGKYPAIQCKKQEGSADKLDISCWKDIRTNDKYTWKALVIKKMKKVKVKATTLYKLAVIDMKMFSILCRLLYLLPLIIKELDPEKEITQELKDIYNEY